MIAPDFEHAICFQKMNRFTFHIKMLRCPDTQQKEFVHRTGFGYWSVPILAFEDNLPSRLKGLYIVR